MNARVLCLGLVLSACGVSPTEHEAATEQVEQLQEQLTHARNKVADLDGRVTELESKLAKATAVVGPDALAVDPPPIELPEVTDAILATTTAKIALSKSGIFLDGKEIADADLDAALDDILDADPDASAIVSADQDVDYKEVVEILDRLKSRGIHKFALAVAEDAAEVSVRRTPRRAAAPTASPDLKNPFTRP